MPIIDFQATMFPKLSAFLILIPCFSIGSTETTASIGKAYEKGVAAYSNEQWSECITQFEDSLHLYKLYKSVIGNCRQKCNNRKYDPITTENIDDLIVFEKFFRRRDCLTKCHDKMFGELKIENNPDDKVLDNLKNRKIYEYLHICYFQMYALSKAASAAYTYLTAHPDDNQMEQNLKYYLQQPEVDVKEIVDMESKKYEDLYKVGVNAYESSKWLETVTAMEEVIFQYMSWEHTCRADCEYQPEQEWSPEFVITVSNNMASLLHCRQQCQDGLKNLNYNSGNEFIAELLNYLQMSYYKLNKLNKAATSVASYLVFYPDDSDMIKNKEYYTSINENQVFEERSDIVYYFKRDSFEKQILSLFH